jgi:hypothetical protein
MAASVTMRCGVCGKEYALTSDYMRQYGGQTTKCECGAAIALPSLAPEQAAEQIRAWRDGPMVVVEKGAKLPRRCFKCGDAVTDPMTQVVLEWTPGKVAPQGIFGLINNAIADTYGQSIIVRYGRCPKHRTHFKKRWVAAAFAALALVCVGAMIWNPSPVVPAVAGIILIVSGVGAGIAMAWKPPLEVRAFQKKRAWVKGFCDAYVKALPIYTAAIDVEAAIAGQALDELAGAQDIE